MQTAFKEWALVVDALGRGEQIIILRKGGIHEGPGGFQIEQPRFFLFPTLFHQQRDLVMPAAASRFDARASLGADESHVSLEFFAEVVGARQLFTLAEAERLRGQHIWRDEVIAKRFDWGNETGLHALALRVHRLPALVELPMLPSYRGCKSWVKLEREIPTSGAEPVLNDEEFARQHERFRCALEPLAVKP